MASPLYFNVALWLLYSLVPKIGISQVYFQKTISHFTSSSVSMNCSQNDTLIIKGTVVKLSDFIMGNGEIYIPCSDKASIRFVHVFSSSRLVIDINLIVPGSKLVLYFLAPIWDIVGTRILAVNGNIGVQVEKAQDGDIKDINGKDGKPGLPGGPGGLFFGIGETFINGENLVITANGGIGGTGQNGGDGYNEVKGRYVDIKALGKIWCGLYFDICKSNDKQHQLYLQDNNGNYNNFTCKGLYETKNMETCSYKIFGWEGKDGGRGGNGGRGGKGGLPGSVEVVELNKPSRISRYSTFGLNGKDGKGGKGGRSGSKGHDIIYEDVNFLAPPKIYLEQRHTSKQNFAPCGIDGYNTGGFIDSPEKANLLDKDVVLNVVNEYKRWLRNISCEPFNNYTGTFYKKLDENIYVRNLYSMTDFLSEIDIVDEDLYNLNKHANFIPFYESLLSRICYYVEFYNSETNKVEQITILKLLYTDILGRIYNINQHSETHLVTEIPSYFEQVKYVFTNLSDLITKNSSFDAVALKLNELSKYKENYETQFQSLIEQFRHHLKIVNVPNETLPNEDLTTMSNLVSDIVVFKKKPLAYEQELLVWGKKLQNAFLQRANKYVVKLIYQIFTVLSDFSELFGTIVELGSSIPDNLVLGDKVKKNFDLDQNIMQKVKNGIENVRNDEFTRNTLLIKNVFKKVTETPEILSDVREELLIVDEKLRISGNTIPTFIALLSDLLQVIKIKSNELSTFNVAPSKKANPKEYYHVLKIREVFSKLRRVIKIASLGRGFADIYNKFEFNNTKLDVILEHTDKLMIQLQAAKRHEDLQCTVTYQMLQHIEDTILEMSKTSDELLNTASEVIKWNIPHILIQMKYFIQEFTTSVQTKDYTIHILENLNGISTALGDMFHRFKSVCQKKQLENHIGDTTNKIKTGIKFTDENLTKQYEKVKTKIGSNLILQHYKKAVENFKHYVFPIAHIYINDIVLPSQFDTRDDFSKTVSTVLTQIDKFLGKVEDYKSLILNGKGIVGRKNFGGWQTTSGKPFFVWKNNEYNSLIVELLSGKEVVFNADIEKSDSDENAIKFNKAHFIFKIEDSTIQDEFNELFEGNFDIYQEHLGNSQYQYSDKVYLITSDPAEMYYTAGVIEDGEPMPSFGGLYEYIMAANIMLSPYASWKVHLTEEADITFDDLLRFKDYIDIEMVGNGYYIDKEKVQTLDLHINKYYKALL